ncbi:MAG: prepilin-type N-terminal cleavage/methylation domain-containing protein [Candidatus Sedimenticola sp. 20ELBAFRAG]
MKKMIHGFTVIELLVTMAVVGILTAIAIPSYRSYVDETRLNVARMNVEPLRLALEEYWIKNGNYVAGKWSKDGATTLESGNLDWKPSSDGEAYIYTVSAASCDHCTIANSYDISVTHKDLGEKSVTYSFEPDPPPPSTTQGTTPASGTNGET